MHLAYWGNPLCLPLYKPERCIWTWNWTWSTWSLIYIVSVSILEYMYLTSRDLQVLWKMKIFKFFNYNTAKAFSPLEYITIGKLLAKRRTNICWRDMSTRPSDMVQDRFLGADGSEFLGHQVELLKPFVFMITKLNAKKHAVAYRAYKWRSKAPK